MEIHATLTDLCTTRIGIFCLTHLLSSLSFHPSISSPLDVQKTKEHPLLIHNHSFLWHDTAPSILHYTTPLPHLRHQYFSPPTSPKAYWVAFVS